MDLWLDGFLCGFSRCSIFYSISLHRTTGKVLLLKDIHNLRATVNERQRDLSLVLSEHAASNPDDDVWSGC